METCSTGNLVSTKIKYTVMIKTITIVGQDLSGYRTPKEKKDTLEQPIIEIYNSPKRKFFQTLSKKKKKSFSKRDKYAAFN